jgi:hypothetical protein
MTGGPVAETASPLDEPVEIARGVTKLLAGCTRLELKAHPGRGGQHRR